jgi:Xaa-Pro aminopeptidase
MTTSRCAIFIDKNKVDSDVKGYFDECGVEVVAYGVDEVEKWIKAVKGLRGEVKSEFKVFAPKSVSWALATAVGIVSVDPYACLAPLHSISTSIYSPLPQDNLSIISCPVDAAKAIKNSTEIEGFRRAYLRDGAAMVRWMAWLEDRIKRRKENVGEWEAGEKLTEYRSLEKYNR